MPEHFPKFLFLGVMIAVTAIGNNLYSGKNSAIRASALTLFPYLRSSTPPIFLLSSPAAPPIFASNRDAEISSSPTSAPRTSSLLFLGEEKSSAKVISRVIPGEGDYENQPATVVVSPLIPLKNAGIAEGSLSPVEGIAPRVFYQIHNVAQPLVNAKSALLADLLTGETYFTFNPDQRWPLASITKLVTAGLTMKYNDLSQLVTLGDRDFLITENENPKYLKAGDSYSIKDLFKIMLLQSSNEAAEALANIKDHNEFIANMNVLVKEWGLTSTYFSDPSGLSAANQSTANDLLKISRIIYEQYPYVFRATQFQKLLVTELNSGRRQTILNINIFAGQSDFSGGKTGYTEEAGGNLLSVFSYRGRPIVIVILGTDDRFGETEKLLEWFKDSFALSR